MGSVIIIESTDNERLLQAIQQETMLALPNIQLHGLMAIPSAFDNSPLSQTYFARELFEQVHT